MARLVPGVVGDEQSVAEDSFSRGLLDFPQYTRPAEIGGARPRTSGLKVPDVLLSGNHAEIRRWRKREALAGRWSGGRICWPARRWTTKNRRFCASWCANTSAQSAQMKEHDNGRDGTGGEIAAGRAAGDEVGRHRPRAREGARRRQGAHPDLRGRRHRPASRRHARVVHGAQGVVRPGRRAHLPAALADDPEGRSHAVGQGPPREAVLPARSEGQGGAHEGHRQEG